MVSLAFICIHYWDSVLSEVWNEATGTVSYLVLGGADKSLARPTSRCRKTESIVSLERGVCSWAELQVFSCYRGRKEACQATRAISKTSRRQLSSSFFFCKARRRRKFTPFWRKHWGNMHHRRPPSKTGWSSLNVVMFPPVLRLVLDDTKQWPSRRLFIRSRTNLGGPPDFG